ncbi:AAA family ATPase [Micromonospora arida]|uniref:AAA family ATPase n=1 Tax=Micromonospora arida TaxID=2203715 RepID=UPI0036B591C1
MNEQTRAAESPQMADTENDHPGADWTNTRHDNQGKTEANPIISGQTSTEDGARGCRLHPNDPDECKFHPDWEEWTRSAIKQQFSELDPASVDPEDQAKIHAAWRYVEAEGLRRLGRDRNDPVVVGWARETYRAWQDGAAEREAAEAAKEREQFEARVAYEANKLRAQKEAARQVAATTDEDEPEPGDDQSTGGWAPEDLTAILDGNYEPELPKLLPRTDGVALLYPGRVHSLHGESESGKSMVAQAETARVLVEGGTVTYVDFESDAALVVGGRLLPMGVPRDAISQRFKYVRPQFDYGVSLESRAAFKVLVSQPADLCVIDGVTEALVTFGKAGRNEDEFTDWFRRLPKKIARKTGAAVVLIDHVTKDSEKRGRFALGSQAKMNALDGAAYTAEVKRALGQGMEGLIELRVGKDRPGQVRPKCGAFQKDRTQLAAWVWVDSTDRKTIKVKVDPPGQNDDDQGDGTRQRKMPPSQGKLLEALRAGGSKKQTIKQLTAWVQHTYQEEKEMTRVTASSQLNLLLGEYHLVRRKSGSRPGEQTLWWLAESPDDVADDDVARCPGCRKPLPEGLNWCRGCAATLDDQDRDARRENDGYYPY